MIIDNFTNLIFLFFILAFILQCYYYLRFYIKPIKKSSINPNKTEPVSIIIAARNEEANLRENLSSICEQDYPSFEVIVVNDCSTDDTLDVLVELSAKYPNLRYTTIEENGRFTRGKKLAITIGIKAAKNEWLLFTDADCKPESTKWLSVMQSKFISDKDIILGYSGFYKEKGILNSFIRFDALFIAIQYLGFAMSGKAYMGVGRNMAYRKSLYFKKNGFTRHLGLASGDDDIFVNDNAKEHNVSVCLDATSFTRSKAKRSFSSWASQKMRHLSASSYYNRASKMSIGIEPLSRLVFYSTFLYLFFLPITWYYFVSFFIIRTILFYLVITMAAKRFNEKNIVLPALLFEIFLPIIIFILMIINKVKPKRKGSWL